MTYLPYMHPPLQNPKYAVMSICLVKQNDGTWIEKHQRFLFNVYKRFFLFLSRFFTFFNVFFIFFSGTFLPLWLLLLVSLPLVTAQLSMVTAVGRKLWVLVCLSGVVLMWRRWSPKITLSLASVVWRHICTEHRAALQNGKGTKYTHSLTQKCNSTRRKSSVWLNKKNKKLSCRWQTCATRL